MPDPDTQLDIFGNEIPVEDLPPCSCPEAGRDPLCKVHASFAGTLGASQIQADEPWPEDLF